MVYDLALIVLGYSPVNFPAKLYEGVEVPDEIKAKLGRL